MRNNSLICHSVDSARKYDVVIVLLPVFPSAPPYFDSSDKPYVDEISSSSAVVTWPNAKGIATDLESHYYYVLSIQTEGEASWKSQKIDVRLLKSRIMELSFNTNYSVKIEPFRYHDDINEKGTTTGITRFKTDCIGMYLNVFTQKKNSLAFPR